MNLTPKLKRATLVIVQIAVSVLLLYLLFRDVELAQAQQILANGKVEICAMKGDEWIRVSGVLVDDNRREPKASMLDEYESLKSMYSADDDNTMVLYFQPGTVTATIWSFKNEPVVMKF